MLPELRGQENVINIASAHATCYETSNRISENNPRALEIVLRDHHLAEFEKRGHKRKFITMANFERSPLGFTTCVKNMLGSYFFHLTIC